MKILCEYSPGGSVPVRTGWKNVLEACNHQFRWWRPGQTPILDEVGGFAPDLLISCTYSVDRAMAKAIAKRPQMKVALFGSAWGGLVDSLDREKYPVVCAGDQEKATIAALKEATGKPDFVFIHVTDKFLDATMGGWRSIGVNPVGVLNAADTFKFFEGSYKAELACDVGYVGGRWPYKSRNIDAFLLPLCHASKKLDVKIFGNTPWPVPQYLGLINDEDHRDLFASAKVCPSVSESHSTDLGFDLVERPYKVMASGAVCVSDFVDEGRGLFGEAELPMAKTPGEFEDLTRYYMGHEDERRKVAAAGRKAVLARHTYFDRVETILRSCGLHDEADGVRSKKRELLNGTCRS